MIRKRLKQTFTQRRALALLLLAQKRYLSNPSTYTEALMQKAARHAHDLDALRVYEFPLN